MTEAEWLACQQPREMLAFLRGKASDRKLRLFAVGCYRHVLQLLSDQRSINNVLVTERFIDGRASLEELRDAAKQARQAYDDGVPRGGKIYHTNAALGATYLAGEVYYAAEAGAAYAAYAAGDDAVQDITSPEAYHQKSGAQATEERFQVHLLRHILGNPFRPYPAPASWPALVVDLAQQLYAGADVRLVLHDALLDAGHAELAEHFGAEEWHPKGCWAMDTLLSKN